MQSEHRRIRIAALADLHHPRDTRDGLQPLLEQVASSADILLICGDLTDHGQPDEARALAKELATSRIPMIGVLGNHDHEGGRAEELLSIFRDSGLVVLDGDAHEVMGIGFAGTKGFAGGFGRGALGPWGESAIKSFVHEAIEEALKLETALARLRSRQRVVVLHYAPIRETVEGEPPEIFPFLGSSRLEEPLARYDVRAVFHGHAHRGAPAGHTATGIPVYNVSMHVLRSSYPDRPPFRVMELEPDERPAGEGEVEGSQPGDSPESRRRADDRG